MHEPRPLQIAWRERRRAMTDGAARYAIYFAPAVGSPWWEFGSRWLGRDERTDSTRERLPAASIDPDVLEQITAAPRRYGFHATLKAPFRLHADATPAALMQRTRALAHALGPVELGPLAPRPLGYFAALQPLAAPAALADLAAACATQIDDLRAPLTPEEIGRRRAAQLDAREELLLQQFGYPYVLERFRFHFTLTGNVDVLTAQRVCDAVQPEVERLNELAPLVVDRLCVFAELQPGRALLRLEDFALGA
jgi:putative phosphonate metabolism protein